MTVKYAQICFFFAQIFLLTTQKKNNLNLKKHFFKKTMVKTFCATCTVNGCPCSNYSFYQRIKKGQIKKTYLRPYLQRPTVLSNKIYSIKSLF